MVKPSKPSTLVECEAGACSNELVNKFQLVLVVSHACNDKLNGHRFGEQALEMPDLHLRLTQASG
jgi:hypothetical protein